MALYTEISNNKECAAKYTAFDNKMNGWDVDVHSPIGYTLAAAAPELFWGLTSKIGNLLNGSEANNESDSVSADRSEQSQREELQRQLKSALREIGAEDENGINEAVHIQQTERDEKVEAAQKTEGDLHEVSFTKKNNNKGLDDLLNDIVG